MVDFHERETRTGHPSLDGAADEADAGGDGNGRDGEDDQPDRENQGTHRAHDDHHPHDDHHHHHPHDDHHPDDDGHHARDLETVRVAVVTISTSRSLDDDPSGDAIVEAFEAAGHEVSTRELLTDDFDGVQGRVGSLARRDDVDVVVTTGGTGVTPDDVTVEAVRPLFEKTLPGFGELFRRRSEAEIGTRVVATRAVGGIADGVPVFCLPGSEAAVRLGVGEIVVPEAGHLAGLARRRDDG